MDDAGLSSVQGGWEHGPGKPASLAERLKKLAGQPCPDCKRKAQSEAAERDAARKRRAEKAARNPRPRPHLGTLPQGATFHLVYDAEAVKWSGTLTIPAPGSGIFRESVVSAGGAVFALLSKLDRMYRGMPAEEGTAESA